MHRTFPVLIAALVLGGCVGSAGHRDLVRDVPAFDVARAFGGATAGEGRLKIAFRRTRGVHVESTGRVAPDGTITVDQIMTEEDGKITTRQWVLRETAPRHYSGSLSDATGPVEGVVEGNCLRLSYPMKGDLTAHQWLYAMPDARTIENRMSIRKSGVLVARLRETISRRDQD